MFLMKFKHNYRLQLTFYKVANQFVCDAMLVVVYFNVVNQFFFAISWDLPSLVAFVVSCYVCKRKTTRQGGFSKVH